MKCIPCEQGLSIPCVCPPADPVAGEIWESRANSSQKIEIMETIPNRHYVYWRRIGESARHGETFQTFKAQFNPESP
jgi:hypothetical protein